ncbi:MAG TPA: IMP dehydrogenase, partial [Methanoregulaceae archaeon]|nr:IMP dehydrogenase [Methanoregulaceae archaeon]
MYLTKLDAPLALTFDDVLLLPAESQVEPNETDTKTLFSKNIPLNIPLVSSAMDTVTESSMAIALARNGGIGVIHRNMSAEQEAAELRFVKQAAELIERKVLSVSPDTSVAEVERLMNEQGIGGVPVLEEGRVVGIVSRRDVRGISSRRGSEKVRTIMTRKPITAGEDITMEQALEVMYTHKVERLPVIDKEGGLAGIITMQDILEKRQYPNATRGKTGTLRVATAVGPFDFERAMLLDEEGTDALVVDCAHGHNMNVVKSVRNIKGSAKADVIAGNIATAKAAEDLMDTVDGLKVGIGPGSICTTRIVAGVGVPQITAVASVADVVKDAG